MTSTASRTAVPRADVDLLDPRRPSVRLCRALGLAALGVGSAVSAHLLGDGCLALWSLAVLGSVGLGAAYAVLGRERSGAALLGWLVAAQVLGHLVLRLGCDDTAGRPGSQLGHAFGAPRPVMLATHAVAVFACALVLRVADRSAWSAWDAARAPRRAVELVVALLVLQLRALRPRPAVPPPAPAAVPDVRSVWQRTVPVRRGPPRVASA